MIDPWVAWLGRALFLLVLGFGVAPAADLATAYFEHSDRRMEAVASHDTDRPADEPAGSGRTCQGSSSCWSLPRAPAFTFLLRPPERVVASLSSDILTEWTLPPLDRPPRSAA